MELATLNGKVETSGNLERSSFKIATTRKAFEILSSGLYSDKITAIIRELSTNAADSHTAAKQTKPFIVHLPSRMEPYFSVKDFGTGLSDADVKGIYTTYFDSNRNRSNDFTGCLGLGSKSPFSYVEQFAVESRFNGVLTTYTCFIDEEGTPEVTKMTETPTNEENGLEVKLSVKDMDASEFVSKAANVLQWFAVRPQLAGGISNFRWPQHEYERVTPGYKLYKNNHGFSRVIMGNVAYSFNPNELEGLNNALKKAVGWGLEIPVPIGSVEVAASREKLGFNKATKKFLTDKLGEIEKDLINEAKNFLVNAKTMWEAQRLYRLYKDGVVGSFMTGNVQWNGIPVKGYIDLRDYCDPPLVESIDLSYRASSRLQHRSIDTIPAYAEGRLFINDVKNDGPYIRLQYLLDGIKKSGKNIPNTFLINLEERPANFKPDANTKNLPPIKQSGLFDEAVKLSTLPKPPPNTYKSSDGRRPHTTLMAYTGKHSYTPGDWWANEKVDLSKGGVYVVTHRYYITDGLPDGRNPFSLDKPGEVNHVLDACKILGKPVKALYGIRTYERGRLLKDPNDKRWFTLHQYCLKVMEEQKDILKELALAMAWDGLSSTDWFNGFDPTAFPVKSPFRKLLEEATKAKTAHQDPKLATYRELAAWAKLDLKVKTDTKWLERMHQDVRKRYPLWEHVVWSNPKDNNFVTRMTEYVRHHDRRCS